jgi:hypothetical protein
MPKPRPSKLNIMEDDEERVPKVKHSAAEMAILKGIA